MNTKVVKPDATQQLLSRLLLNREQVSELLGVGGSTIDHLHRTGRLAAVKVGRENRWRPDTVKEYVAGLETES